jgi:hypothetical protein
VTLTDIDEPRLAPPPSPRPRRTPARPARLWGLRAAVVVLGLVAWFATQSLIGSRAYEGGIGDGLLQALGPVNAYLHAHVAARHALLIASSAVIDALALFLFARAIFGTTVRPFLGLLLLFALRQISQGLCALPVPDGMIWEHPGFPSLLVTYGVSNDFFFSGHTAIAVFGAVELVRWGGTKLLPLAVAIALFEALTVLALRAHWTMDVYAGAATALLVACLATRFTPPVDRLLARAVGMGRR